jgi:hypothetical protein
MRNDGKLRLIMSVAIAVSMWIGEVGVIRGAKPTNDLRLSVQLRNDSGDGVLSDAQGLYVDGITNVRAVLLDNTAGNFIFDTNDSSNLDGGRRLRLHFHGQPSPFATASQPFDIDTFLGTLGVNGNGTDRSLRTMHINDVLPRRMRIGWAEGNVSYSLAWNGPENGHSFVNFTCVAPTDTQAACTTWVATPNGSAGLYSVPTKGKFVETFYGTYTMPFQMTLTQLP